MHCCGDLFVCSLETYFGVHFPCCFKTWKINTKITLLWSHTQFTTPVHTIISMHQLLFSPHLIPNIKTTHHGQIDNRIYFQNTTVSKEYNTYSQFNIKRTHTFWSDGFKSRPDGQECYYTTRQHTLDWIKKSVSSSKGHWISDRACCAYMVNISFSCAISYQHGSDGFMQDSSNSRALALEMH